MTAVVSWLVGRGLTAEQAVLWAEFINDCLELIRDAHALLTTSGEWTSFVGGCRAARPTEPELTSGLGDRVERLWVDAPMDSARTNIDADYEHCIPGDHVHGIRKNRADFWFKRKFDAGYCVHFAIEAKRLMISGDLSRKYLSPAGLGCFLDRVPPYTQEVIAGMVGYTHDASVAWYQLLGEKIEAEVPHLRVGEVDVPAVGILMASDHDRGCVGISEDVTVLHLMLPI